MAAPIRQFVHADLIEEVLPPRYDGLVWHYSSADGLLGILRGQALWASSITQLNDTDELEHGLQLIEDTWRASKKRSIRHRGTISEWIQDARAKVMGSERLDSYLVCASTLGQSQTQFLMYGSYAIGINGAYLLEKRPAESPPVAGDAASGAFDLGWRPVRYEWRAKRAHIDKLFQSLVALAVIAEAATKHDPDAYEAAIECIIRSAIYMKHESFEHEQEVRLYGRAKATNALVDFRVGKYGIVPYLTVELGKELQRIVGRFPVVQINVGPGLGERESAKAGLGIALERLGYEHVRVEDYAASRRP